MPAPDIKFDAYHDYEAMTAHLKALAAAFPKLATLESLGKTFQGRDIWPMRLPIPIPGPPRRSPATTSMRRSTPKSMPRAPSRSTRSGIS